MKELEFRQTEHVIHSMKVGQLHEMCTSISMPHSISTLESPTNPTHRLNMLTRLYNLGLLESPKLEYVSLTPFVR